MPATSRNCLRIPSSIQSALSRHKAHGLHITQWLIRTAKANSLHILSWLFEFEIRCSYQRNCQETGRSKHTRLVSTPSSNSGRDVQGTGTRRPRLVRRIMPNTPVGYNTAGSDQTSNGLSILRRHGFFPPDSEDEDHNANARTEVEDDDEDFSDLPLSAFQIFPDEDSEEIDAELALQRALWNHFQAIAIIFALPASRHHLPPW
ncbi:hypothetical protein C8R47DRAFT_184435 [Mycena vitilis]|nr:hypothetical protein C8R47DRAFT_184435 [Mycena vitilis]